MQGKFIINNKVWYNNIMDEGIKKLNRILADNSETNINLIKISLGTSDVDPEDTTKSALVAEVGSKYDIGTHSVNAIFPFDLELTTTVPADDITAGTILKEIGIWFGPVGAEVLFARATDVTGLTVQSGQALPVSYDLVIL